MNALPDDVISYVIATSPLVDAVRYLTALFGLLVFCMALVRFMQHTLVWSGVAGMSIGMLTAVQQFEALGTPFLPWRLPLLVIANVATAIHLYRARSVEDGP